MVIRSARFQFQDSFKEKCRSGTLSDAQVHPLIDGVVGITKHDVVFGGQQLDLVGVNFRVQYGRPLDPRAIDRIGRDEFRPLSSVVAEPRIVHHPGLEAQIEGKLTAGDDLGRDPGLPHKTHRRLIIPPLGRFDHAVNYGSDLNRGKERQYRC